MTAVEPPEGFAYVEPEQKRSLLGTYDPEAGEWDYGHCATLRWGDLFGIAPNLPVSDELMGIGELSEGMRVRMPSGQVLTVTNVSGPDEGGMVRVTCATDDAIRD